MNLGTRTVTKQARRDFYSQQLSVVRRECVNASDREYYRGLGILETTAAVARFFGDASENDTIEDTIEAYKIRG